ncbi:hypothetical protein Tco_0144563 [Tanacetum coccineum]
MATVSTVPQLVDKKGGSYAAIAPKLESGKFNKWKKRMLCYLAGIEPYYIQCIKDGPFKPKTAEGPSDTKENKIVDLKLKYQKFRAKPSESLSQTYTRYNTLLNKLANNGVNLYKHEINVSFVNSLLEKWLTFSQRLRNANHTQTLDLANIYGSNYRVNMDDPNITMEQYIQLEEEKARRRGLVYNWVTATHGKIWYDEYVHYLSSFEKEFPAIVYKDALTSEQEIASEPTVSYFNDFDYFKDFEKEFPTIAYNYALTSKLDLSEPTVSPQHIDEFDKTSLSECDDEGQNVIYFNDLFPFNVNYPDDLSDKDNDNDKIDIEQFLGDLSIEPLPGVIKIDAQWSNKLFETSHDTISKIFTAKNFIKEFSVNIVTWNYLNNGMLFK